MTNAVSMANADSRAESAPPLAHTINQTCRLMSVSRSHIYALIADGRIRAVKVGNRTLILRAEIERILSAA